MQQNNTITEIVNFKTIDGIWENDLVQIKIPG